MTQMGNIRNVLTLCWLHVFK